MHAAKRSGGAAVAVLDAAVGTVVPTEGLARPPTCALASSPQLS
jgi:hypothetical protein